MIAKTPEPPYYAVIFSSIRTGVEKDYAKVSAEMEELASQQEGFLGVETVRDGLGINISYWKDLESIRKWKEHSEHVIARRRGHEEWYRSFKVRIALVERDYEFGFGN